MKGRVVLLDHIADRQVAALMVDGKLHDLLVDPPDDAPPGVGAIFFAVADRPLKGQGGITLRLGDGLTGFMRRAKDIAPGDAFFVQVSGVAEPGKAVPVSPDLVFKSRFGIVTPDKPGINVSRAIRDDDERDRLLEIAHETMDSDYGLILRSSAAGADGQDVADDIASMQDLALQVLGHDQTDPVLLWAAESAHHMAWRDWEHPDEVVTDDGCFEAHGVLEAVDAALSPRQPLVGGGHAYIEATRALIAVDVNTGKDHSLAAGLKANLALVRDLPRLTRIKGLGGQFTLDLAPMPKRDRKQVEDAVKKAFRLGGGDVVVAGWTPLGNLELTRKRDRAPLAQVWPR